MPETKTVEELFAGIDGRIGRLYLLAEKQDAKIEQLERDVANLKDVLSNLRL